MKVLDLVAEHLEAVKLRFRRLNDAHDGPITLGFAGSNTNYAVYFVDRGLALGVVAVLEGIVRVPKDRVEDVIGLANLVNRFILKAGAFSVAPDGNGIFFDWAIPIQKIITAEEIELALDVSQTVDVLFPAFARVVWADLPAAAALASIVEAQPSESATGDAPHNAPPERNPGSEPLDEVTQEPIRRILRGIDVPPEDSPRPADRAAGSETPLM